MMKNLIFEFADIGSGSKIEKTLTKAFDRVGIEVITAGSDGRMRRSSGVSYKDLMLTMVDGQTVTLSVKSTGDIWRVAINGKVVPLKSPDDHAESIKELAAMLDAGRAKFQAAQAKIRVKLPDTTRSKVAPMAERLKAEVAELDAKIGEAKAKRDELLKTLSESAMDSLTDAFTEDDDCEADCEAGDVVNDAQASFFDEAGDEPRVEVDPNAPTLFDAVSTNGEWHSKTMQAMREKSLASLRFIIKDATEAAEIGEKMGNPKAGQYRDEAHYAGMEIVRRRKLIAGDKGFRMIELAINKAGGAIPVGKLPIECRELAAELVAEGMLKATARGEVGLP